MILKTYVKYISKEFVQTFLKISFVFYALIFTLNVFEELRFFKDIDVNFLYPILRKIKL